MILLTTGIPVYQSIWMIENIELERDRAYRELRCLILAGQFRYDEALSERALGGLFGVGRTPMREAVRRLVNDGLLTSMPARGVFVRRLDGRELAELYEVRIALEGTAARLATRRATADDIAVMRRTVDLLDAQDALQEIQDTGWELHRQIFAAAGNLQLSQIYEAIINRVIVAMRMTLRHDATRVRRTVDEHRAIFRAITEREPDEAERRMREHLEGALQSRLRISGEIFGEVAPHDRDTQLGEGP